MSSFRNQALAVAAVAAGMMLTSIVACSKKDDAGAPSTVPPLSPGAAPSAAPAPPPPAAPAPPAPEAAAAPAGEGGSITGKIELSPSLAKKKPEGILFLVARRISDNPTARGTLIAVKKLPATTFPLAFDLSAADMPFQNGAFDGELTLSARIDQDGDPMTHQKGDVLGSLPKVRVGSKNVRLTLDQLQKETESLAGPGAMGGARPPMLPPGHPASGLPPGHP